MKKIQKKIKKIPKKPGVYVFRNQKSKIIYIGKALSLRSRVRSYFRTPVPDEKTRQLVKNIAMVDHVVVDSEFDALLLEAKLIKEHQPKYNLQLKDNKSYLYVAVSKEETPRIFLTRRPELKEKLLDWYGPFTSAGDARRIVRFLRRIFPYRSCQKLPKKVCLYYHLELCPGVCLSFHQNYFKTVRRIRQVLSGNTKRLISQLEKEMQFFAKQLEFEKAARIKRQIMSLQVLQAGWKRVPSEKIPVAKSLTTIHKLLVRHGSVDPVTLNKIEAYDIANLGKEIIVGSLVTFINGAPEKTLYRRFKINFQTLTSDARLKLYKQNDPGSIKQIIDRRLSHPEWLFPQLILVDGGKPQVNAAFKALKKANLTNQIALLGLAKKKETIVVPQIKTHKIIGYHTLKLSPRSPALKLLQQTRDEAHRFAQKYFHYLQNKRLDS